MKVSDIESNSGLPFALLNLSNNSLYFQSPNNFNDPYDSRICINECTYEQWEAALRKMIWNDFKNQSETVKLREFENQKRYGSPKRAYDRYRKIIKNKFDKAGILSLTTIPDDMLMWAHYGEQHFGICLEIDIKTLLSKLLIRKLIVLSGHMNYVPYIPEITFTESFLSDDKNAGIDQIQNILFSKWDIWQSENEIRIVIPKIEEQIDNRLISLYF